MTTEIKKGEIYLYNTRTHKKELFQPINPPYVKFYACGPTVYNHAHIGNLRAYIMEDILRRVLEYNGFIVKHVMNITDVGHLTQDSDFGQDKIEEASKKEGKTAYEIAEKYEKLFFQDLEKLNIEKPHIIAHATKHIKEMIDLIKKLEEKGYTYRTSDGIYFDTSKFKEYGILSKKENIKPGARVNIGEKKNPTDFALWKFSPKNEKRQMEWESPWGIGFPGWHIECSAMSSKYLGEQYDIHAGGEDHIPIHHENEIAQAEAGFGKKPWVRYWFHVFFLKTKGTKMSKSKGNFYTLQELEEKGFEPLAYRYFCINSYYRTQLNFSIEALQSAQNTLKRMQEIVLALQFNSFSKNPEKKEEYQKKFIKAINNDLQMPEALAVVWEMLRSEIGNKEKYELIIDWDKVLGLKLKELKIEENKEIKALLEERNRYRKEKEFEKADKIRNKIMEKGYVVIDTPNGSFVKKRK